MVNMRKTRGIGFPFDLAIGMRHAQQRTARKALNRSILPDIPVLVILQVFRLYLGKTLPSSPLRHHSATTA
jgi:hypothetical protein